MIKFNFWQQRDQPAVTDRHKKNHINNRSPRAKSLRLETLEDRCLLTITNPLVITEINYNPHDLFIGDTQLEENYEFIEIRNVGTTNIDLNGVKIQAFNNINVSLFIYTFASQNLGADESVIIAKSSAAILDRYGQDAVDAIAVNSSTAFGANFLDNKGGKFTLTATGINTNSIITFTYDDKGDFPKRPDGDGRTLELDLPGDLDAIPINATFYNDGDNWNSSAELGGTPGAIVSSFPNQRIVINEILANPRTTPLPAELEKIELYNTTDLEVDISGWVIGDKPGDSDNRFTFPANTKIPAGEYLAIDESVFSPGINDFSLSSNGDSLELVSTDDGLRHYEDTVEFGATFRSGAPISGVAQSGSIGRVPNGSGNLFPLTNQTFGSENVDPRQSAVIISEVMYHYATGGVENSALEFIELHNTSGNSVNLQNWTISGAIKYTFGVVSIPAGGYLVVYGSGNVVTFKNAYGGLAGVTVLGPFTSGALSNGGERVELRRADGLEPFPSTTFRTVLVDSVDYKDDSLWPEGPDGNAAHFSLNRTSASPYVYGDDPHSWRGDNATPGSASFGAVNSPFDGIVISEIMYNPVADGTDYLEFVEILNTTGGAINLNGLSIGGGIQFTFTSSVILNSGDRVAVVSFNTSQLGCSGNADCTAFINAHGVNAGVLSNFHGPFTSILSNSGETISLIDTDGNTFHEVTYSDAEPWADRADGKGSSLELIDPNSVPSGYLTSISFLADGTNWQASNDYNGSPGTGSTAVSGDIVISEILAHTDFPQTGRDSIELFNTTGSAINIGGWYLTDSLNNPFRLLIPQNTFIQGGEYLTLEYETVDYRLNANVGESVWLIEGSSDGSALLQFADQADFGASFNNESLIRIVNSNGNEVYFPQAGGTTLNNPTNQPITDGAPNNGHFVSNVVISEVMYNPTNPDLEFVELYNRSSSTVNLGPIESGAGWLGSNPEGWMLTGDVQFEFTAAHAVASGESIVVVNFNPLTEVAKLNTFRSTYGIDASVEVVGPFDNSGTLPNTAGVVQLLKPDFGPLSITLADRFTPNILRDQVSYTNTGPWPTLGAGESLTRTESFEFGDFATSWNAETASPGDGGFSAPTVTQVILWSSTWSSEFLDSITPAGPASQQQGYYLQDGGNQNDTIPWDDIDRVSIQFSETVTTSFGALAVTGDNIANYFASGSELSNNSDNNTVTWNINTSLENDLINLNLDDAKIRSLNAVSLDGEWVNDTTLFSNGSGNGTAGGDFDFGLSVLEGDQNNDRVVDSNDLQLVISSMFTLSNSPRYSTTADHDGDGLIGLHDLLFARNARGESLQSSPPPAPAAAALVVTIDNNTVQNIDSPLQLTQQTTVSNRSLVQRRVDLVLSDVQRRAATSVRSAATHGTIGRTLRNRSESVEVAGTDYVIHSEGDHFNSLHSLRSVRAKQTVRRVRAIDHAVLELENWQPGDDII